MVEGTRTRNAICGEGAAAPLIITSATPPDTASDRGFSERVLIRFSITLAANLTRIALSFACGLLIARSLGAASYGDLNFVLGSFLAISQLIEAGSATAFYTFISKRQHSSTFFTVYAGWMLFQLLVPLLVVTALIPGWLMERIWIGQERRIVLLGLLASFLMNQLWGAVSQLGEAARKTLIVQTAAVLQGVVHLALVFAALHWHWLTVSGVLWLLIGEYSLLVVILTPRLIGYNVTRGNPQEDVVTVLKQFGVYCKPMVAYCSAAFLYAFADRWLLQRFGGAIQQGFFAIGQQFANVSLIATTSILRVFWKEIAEARQLENHQRVRFLYSTVTRTLYFSAAWISCLLIPYSREILILTVGKGYEKAWLCLALMWLYPVHQTIGQIQGTFFFASGETRSYAKIGIGLMVCSIPVTYLLLAPRAAIVPGLALGSVGLAIKMVVLQLVGVTIQAHVIARANDWKGAYLYQAVVLLSLLTAAWAGKIGIQLLFGTTAMTSYPVIAIASTGLVYSAFSLLLLYRWPELAGLTRERLDHWLGRRAAAADITGS